MRRMTLPYESFKRNSLVAELRPWRVKNESKGTSLSPRREIMREGGGEEGDECRCMY